VSGAVAVDVAAERAVPAVLIAAATVAAVGLWSARATESAGEGTQPLPVIALATGLGALLVTTALLARRRTRSGPAQRRFRFPARG